MARRKRSRGPRRPPGRRDAACALVINRTGATLASHVVRAEGLWSRVAGLMFRSRLEPGEGLWIPRCSSVHTCFMRFALDLVFLDADMRVTRVAGFVRPFRARFGGRRAQSVVELPAGTLAKLGLRAGDWLRVTPIRG